MLQDISVLDTCGMVAGAARADECMIWGLMRNAVEGITRMTILRACFVSNLI
jgi:hypothetical protein